MATREDWISVMLSEADVAEAEAWAIELQRRRRDSKPHGLGSFGTHRTGALVEDAFALYRGVPKNRLSMQAERLQGWDVDGYAVRGGSRADFGLPLIPADREHPGVPYVFGLVHDSPAIWLVGELSYELAWARGRPMRTFDSDWWRVDQSDLEPLPARNGYAPQGERWLVDPQTPFWCEICNGMHPIIEHRVCRASGV